MVVWFPLTSHLLSTFTFYCWAYLIIRVTIAPRFCVVSRFLYLPRKHEENLGFVRGKDCVRVRAPPETVISAICLVKSLMASLVNGCYRLLSCHEISCATPWWRSCRTWGSVSPSICARVISFQNNKGQQLRSGFSGVVCVWNGRKRGRTCRIKGN